MKANQIFSMWVAGVLVLVMAGNVFAQGRGNSGRDEHPGRGYDKEIHPGKGHDKHKYDYDRKDSRNRYDSYHSHNRYTHHDTYHHCDHDRYVIYRHHRSGPPAWAPAYGHRYNTRYIYYRDYNVYYDCHRDIFITWTGRNWRVTTHIPDVMCHVDFRTATVAGIDYWDDDFEYYLDRKRPSYVSIRASW